MTLDQSEGPMTNRRSAVFLSGEHLITNHLFSVANAASYSLRTVLAVV
jgi:hypothetical protein